MRWVGAGAVLLAMVVGAGCGSDTAAVPSSTSASPAASQAGDVHSCGTSSPSASASASASPRPLGAAQALSVIAVEVTTTIGATPGALLLGTVSCLKVGVGQVVTLQVDARIPPAPAEASGSQRLSAITVSPAPPTGSAPLPGRYSLTFTAQTAGVTTITYLPATCTLAPGVC